MGSSNVVQSKASLTLDLPPSCIQFCPAHPRFFVVGTYNLQRDETAGQSTSDDQDGDDVAASRTPQSRNGSLLVFKIDGVKLTLVQTVSQPSAILDLRFHPASGREDVLAVVSSTGSLAVFQLDPETAPTSPLKHIATSRCNDLGEDVLFLQCNWYPAMPNVLGVTTSTGTARLLRLDEDYRIRDPSVDLDITNSLEAWCINFSPIPPSNDRKDTQATAYCGGDDSMLRCASCVWNAADEEQPCEAPFPPVVIKGQHDAGVTAILPLSLSIGNSRVVVTGSYDDHLRVFLIEDPQKSFGMKRVQLVLEENLGGGVWRLDLVNIRHEEKGVKIRILASCMHAGARLLDLEVQEEKDWRCDVLARFEEHKSMNYGSDFVRDGKGDGLRCVSTSFYDKLLCVWEYEPLK